MSSDATEAFTPEQEDMEDDEQPGANVFKRAYCAVVDRIDTLREKRRRKKRLRVLQGYISMRADALEEQDLCDKALAIRNYEKARFHRRNAVAVWEEMDEVRKIVWEPPTDDDDEEDEE